MSGVAGTAAGGSGFAGVTNDPTPDGGLDAADALGAADAVGAPLSELARMLMQHEPALEVTVPGWVADVVACCGRRWDVTTEVASAWLLAEGVARLVHAADADLLDGLVAKVPGLDVTAGDDTGSCRQLRVPTPGAELHVALGRLAGLTGTESRHVAAFAVVWGAERLHDTDDDHSCAAAVGSGGDTTTTETTAGDHHGLDAHDAAVLAEVPIDALALGLLAPKQHLAVSLPAFADDWLRCIAARWHSSESVTATWLLAEGAAYLVAMEVQYNTAWRTGPTRWVIPPEHPNTGPRLVETPGAQLQDLLGRLAACCGDDHQGIAALAVATGAKLWIDGHNCACDGEHIPRAGVVRRVGAGELSDAERQSLRRLRLRWMRLRWPRPRPDQSL